MRKPVCCVIAVLIAVSVTHALDRQPNADYRARRQAVAAKANGGVVLLFAPLEAEGPNDLYGFRQDDNFYYLTGWAEPGAALLIAPATQGKNAHSYTEILYLPAHNVAQEKWTGPKLGPENPDAARITGFDRVEAMDNIHQDLTRILPEQHAVIYSDVQEEGETSNSTSAFDWLNRDNAFPLGASFQDVRPLLSSLRTFKDGGEIELIRKAAQASVAAHLAVLHSVKPGMSEREVSALLQYEWGKRGCERPAYAPIVGSGFNSTVLHYSQDSGPIRSGDVIVIDAAGEYSMYAADITRTLPADGRFTPRQREIYNIVLGAQQAAIDAFQSGKSTLKRDGPNSLYKVAYDYLNSHGKDLHGEPLGKYFIHGLGHYLGLSVHDPGDYEVPLGPGVVFTLEPGLYIPEEKLGVRIEDDFYIDASGKLIQLSAGLPRTPDEVEHAMAAR